MFKFKSKKQVVPDLPETEYSESVEGASKTCGRFYRSKGFIVAACLALVLGVAVNARGVFVVNFAELAALAQEQVAKAITDQLQSIQNDLLALKKISGDTNITNLKTTLTNNTNEKLLDAAGQDSFSSVTGAFGEGKSIGALAEYNQTNFKALVSQSFSVPSVVGTSDTDYMNNIRKISLLMAGGGGGGTTVENNKLSLIDKASKKMEDVLTQSRIGAFEEAGSAAYMAQQLKEQAKNIDVSTSKDKNSYPEQVIKDIAKLTYYEVMLKAEQLQMQAKEIQRASLMNR